MFRILRPHSSDPALRRKLLIVRLVFLLIAVVLAVLFWRWGLREGMPDTVPSSSRRRGGPDVMWDASPVEFTMRFLNGVLALSLVVVVFDALTEGFVSRRHATRPRKHKRYPH